MREILHGADIPSERLLRFELTIFKDWELHTTRTFDYFRAQYGNNLKDTYLRVLLTDIRKKITPHEYILPCILNYSEYLFTTPEVAKDGFYRFEENVLLTSISNIPQLSPEEIPSVYEAYRALYTATLENSNTLQFPLRKQGYQILDPLWNKVLWTGFGKESVIDHESLRHYLYSSLSGTEATNVRELIWDVNKELRKVNSPLEIKNEPAYGYYLEYTPNKS